MIDAPLFERERELSYLRSRRASRWITVVGSPGSGKTRLAIQLARSAPRPEGTVFVDLQDVAGLPEAAARIMRAAGARLDANTEELDALPELPGRRTPELVVLDSADALDEEERRQLGAKLARCAAVRVVATADRPLGLEDEKILTLQGLQRSGARLFLARVHRLSPPLAREEAMRSAAVDIAARFAGHPLSIELAAARACAIGCLPLMEELAAETFGAPPRIDDLLDRAAATLPPWASWMLASIAAIRGPLDVDEVRAMTQGAKDAPVLLDALEWLCDAGWLCAIERPSPEPTVMFTVRRQARAALLARCPPEQLDAARDRMLELVAERSARLLAGAVTTRGLAELSSALERLADAVDHAHLGPPRLAPAGVAAALALDEVLARGALPTLREQTLRRARDLLARAEAPPRLRARAHLAWARFQRDRGDQAAAQAEIHACRSSAADAPDVEGRALRQLGLLALRAGRVAAAEEPLRRALAQLEDAGDAEGASRAAEALAEAVDGLGRSDEALALARRALALEPPDSRHHGVLLARLAAIELSLGQLAPAAAHFEEAVEALLSAGGLGGLGLALLGQGLGQQELGQRDDARRKYREAIRLLRIAGHEVAQQIGLALRGSLDEEDGRRDEAREAMTAAVAGLGRRRPRSAVELLPALYLAGLAASEGRMSSARELLAGAAGPAIELFAGDALALARAHVELVAATQISAPASLRIEAIARAERAARRLTAERASAAHPLGTAFLLRRLERALGAPAPAGEEDAKSRESTTRSLIFDARSGVVRLSSGAEIDLSRRPTALAVFAHLLRARLERPGLAQPSDRLIQVGWPDERVAPDAAANRLYALVSLLRRLGLRDVIERTEGGYAVSPALDIIWRGSSCPDP
ncbi:MAG: hypothetical protein U0359_12170 [Byssovorax sp.]